MGIRPGDKVSLLVWARGSSTRPLLSDLKAHSPDCKTPIPVTSLPITMATNVPHSDKHSRIQRSFMFEKSLIHILEDTSYDLDKVGDNCWRWQLVNMFQKLWDSGLAMSAILTEKISSEKYNFFGGSSKPLRIMELGGWCLSLFTTLNVPYRYWDRHFINYSGSSFGKDTTQTHNRSY